MRIPLETTRNILLALTFALGAACAYAQPMFRSVMPDGKIVYGDKPAPGAKESKQLNLAPLNIAAPPQGSSSAETAAAESAATADKNAELATARRNLEAAQQALEQGRAERDGDRIGTAGGKSRLNDDYVQRVKSLEDAAAAAQQQVDLAQRNLNQR
jgi:hypothetical protein